MIIDPYPIHVYERKDEFNILDLAEVDEEYTESVKNLISEKSSNNHDRFVKSGYKETLSIKNAHDHVTHILSVGPNNVLASDLFSNLMACGVYKDIYKKMPTLNKVPYIHNYRSKYGALNIKNQMYSEFGICLNSEINRYGVVPCPGQKLFHGGDWLGENSFVDIVVGKEIELTKPLSTTFCPQVAWVHAQYHKDKAAVWMFSIDVEISTPAYFFRPRGKMAHELEVLFASGLRVKCIEKKYIDGIAFIEAVIR